MAEHSLIEAWRDGGCAVGAWVSRGHDFTIDLFQRAGYDFVGIDCQHTMVDETTVAGYLYRMPADAPATLVRVSRNDPALIGKLADAGADGVIVPMVNSAAEAAAAVAAVTYPPFGIRSYGPMRPDMGQLDLAALTARVRVFVMIETAEALDRVDEIVAVPGVAGVYVGPSDLSIGLGLDPGPAFSSDQLLEPIERVRQACERAGVILGMHQVSGTGAATWIARGVRLVSISDRLMLARAAADELAVARSTGAR